MRSLAIFITLTIATLALALALSPWSGPVNAQGEPEITFIFPHEGDTFAEPLLVLQMCFAEPINNKDLDKGGDFDFALTPPNTPRLGMRIVFQPDGQGVAVYPGFVEGGSPEGEWTFAWRVTDAATLEPLEGVTRYSVREGGGPILQSPPATCVAGSTPTLNTPPVIEDPDDDGPDVLLLALLTIGAAGAAAVIALIGYVIRNRVGFWLHRPPERKDGADESHQ
jgi:hypothetical protein